MFSLMMEKKKTLAEIVAAAEVKVEGEYLLKGEYKGIKRRGGSCDCPDCVAERARRKSSPAMFTIEVIQQPPCCRVVRIDGTKYYLALPWTQIGMIRSTSSSGSGSCYLTITNEEVKDVLNDTLYLAPLPNNRSNGLLCSTPANDGQSAVIRVWGSQFKGSYLGLPIMRKFLTSYANWQEKSKEDPSFITKIEWKQTASNPYKELVVEE